MALADLIMHRFNIRHLDRTVIHFDTEMDCLTASWEAIHYLYFLVVLIFVVVVLFYGGKLVLGYFVEKIQRFRYLVAGPQIIDQAYAVNPNNPFRILTPSNNHLMITSSKLIKEVLDTPPQRLSLHAVAKELLQPKYTMYGFEWQEQRGAEGTGFVRALRSRLTSHLPQFQSKLDRIIKSCLEEELSKPDSSGSVPVKLFPMVKRVVTKVNCFVFFGERLSENTEFTEAALEFPQTVVFAAELLRITPAFLRPFVTYIVTQRHRAAKTLFRYLEPEVRVRLANRAKSDQEGLSEPAAVDCMQWLIDTSPRKNPWTTPRMIGEILAIWFSSVHQLAMTATYVIEDLCLRDEYVESLRDEIQKAKEGRSNLEVGEEQLPLLDSFMKESIRFTNADALSCRRKALEDFTLSDGSYVQKDDWVCIPQRAMMCDSQRYSEPHTFDGYRFARANAQLRQGLVSSNIPDKFPSSLTSASLEWPIWGLGTATCPGRFYASLVLKLLAANILLEWECKMRDKSAPRSMVWRSSIVPRSDTVVMFRKRNDASVVSKPI